MVTTLKISCLITHSLVAAKAIESVSNIILLPQILANLTLAASLALHLDER